MRFEPFRGHSDINRCLTLASLAMLLCLPMILWQKSPETDVRNYYIPMIQAFASGNWEHAYWPMIPPLFPTFAGILATILPLPAFTVAKLTSSLFFVGTVFPLYFLNARVFDSKKIATCAVLLYMVCDPLLRYGGAGILSSGKVFFLTSSVFFLIESMTKRTFKTAVFFSVSLAGLSLIRGEGIAAAGLIGGLFLVAEWRANQTAFKSFSRRCLPVKFMVVLMMTTALLSPWFMYQYTHVGYPVIDSRQIKFLPFKKMIKNKQELSLPYESGALAALRSAPHPASDATEKYNLWDSLLDQLFKGFYPLYFMLYVPVIFFRMRKKKWTGNESMLLISGVGHTLIILGVLGCAWTQKRYIIAALPLFLGWTAMGFFQVWEKANQVTRNSRSRWLPKGVVGAIILGMLWSGTSRTRPSLNPRKRNRWALNLECARWLADEGSKYQPVHFSPLKSDQNTYHSGQLPTIAASLDLPVFMTHGEIVEPHLFRNHYTADQFIRFCELKRIQFVVLDKKTTGLGEEMADLVKRPEFVLLASFRVGEQSTSILGFCRNLKSIK